MMAYRSNVAALEDFRNWEVRGRQLGWLDARTNQASPGLAAWAAAAVSIKPLPAAAWWRFPNLGNEVSGVAVEFDRPRPIELRRLSDMVRWHASLPVVVFSEYHAEDLAVWAFRSGVADFIVTPLCKADLTAILLQLTMHREGPTAQRRTTLPALTSHRPPPLLDELNGTAAKRTGIAATYILRNFGRRIKEHDMAQLCHMSISEFSRAFHRENKVCFREFLLRRRLRAAASLLQTSNLAVANIAFEVGFSDASQLSRHFQQFYATTPSDYRTRQRRTQDQTS